MTPDELQASLKRFNIPITHVAERAGIHRVSLHQHLTGQVEPGIHRWQRILDAYYELLAERTDAEWTQRQRRLALLDAHPDLKQDLQLFAGAAVVLGTCSEMYIAAACGLTFEEWNALPVEESR